MLNIRGMSTADSLLSVMVHPAALLLHCETYPHCFLNPWYSGRGCVNARPDPVTPRVLLRGFPRLERSQIVPLAGLGVCLDRIKPVFAGFEFPDHGMLLRINARAVLGCSQAAGYQARCAARREVPAAGVAR